MTEISIVVRDARAADADQLLGLMRELAMFEGYIGDFRVTKEELVRRGFGSNAEFFSVVAESKGDGLVGMAIGYLTPFTYTLEPSATLKELFVMPPHRSSGLGRQLVVRFVQAALVQGARSLRWTVLGENQGAKLFYEKLGGRHDSSWEPWKMDGGAMERLVNSGT